MSTGSENVNVAEPTSVAAAAMNEIEKELENYLKGRIYPDEIATSFNYILYDAFNKARAIEGGDTSLKPEFVGQYKVDPADPGQTRVFCHQGTKACSPILITEGAIGRAVSTGEDQYLPDVSQVPWHKPCEESMHGTENVLISWSEPYSEGEYHGQRVPLGVLDIDLNVKNALGPPERLRLRRIWDTYGKLIFPGEAPFRPSGGIFVRSSSV